MELGGRVVVFVFEGGGHFGETLGVGEVVLWIHFGREVSVDVVVKSDVHDSRFSRSVASGLVKSGVKCILGFSIFLLDCVSILMFLEV